MPILTFVGRGDLATQMMRDELQPVADAKYGLAHPKHSRISGRRIGIVNRAWATGEDDTERFITLNLRERCRTRQHNGGDILLANAACNELGVLSTKIQDDDRRGVHALVYLEMVKIGDGFTFASLHNLQNCTNATSRAT